MRMYMHALTRRHMRAVELYAALLIIGYHDGTRRHAFVKPRP